MITRRKVVSEAMTGRAVITSPSPKRVFKIASIHKQSQPVLGGMVDVYDIHLEDQTPIRVTKAWFNQYNPKPKAGGWIRWEQFYPKSYAPVYHAKEPAEVDTRATHTEPKGD